MSAPDSAYVLDWISRLQTKEAPSGELRRLEPIQQNEKDVLSKNELEVLRLLLVNSLTVGAGTGKAIFAQYRLLQGILENTHAIRTERWTFPHHYLQTVGRIHRIDTENATDEDLAKEFNERADRWEKESRIHSSPGEKFLHEDYQTIIGMGERAIPLILDRLEESNSDWLWALEHIVPKKEQPRHFDSYKVAVQAWIGWGKTRYPSRK